MKWLTALAIASVFLMGTLAGALIGMKIERDRLYALASQPADLLARSTAKAITKEVKLDRAQQDKLNSLLDAARPALESAENSRRESISAVITSVGKDLDPILSPPQRERSRSLFDRLRRRFLPGPVSVPVSSKSP